MFLSCLCRNVDRSLSESPATNPYHVYELSLLEYEQREVIMNSGKVYLCRRKENKNEIYEVILRQNLLWYIFVLYTGPEFSVALRVYQKCSVVMNELIDSMPHANKYEALLLFREMMMCLRVNDNWSPAHIAARVGLEYYFKLKNKKIDINNQVEPDRMTPFHTAIYMGHFKIVKIMINLKPDYGVVDISGMNALHFACISSGDILNLIASQPNVLSSHIRCRTNKGCTPLHLVVYSNNFLNFVRLLKFNLPVDTLNLIPPDSYEASKRISSKFDAKKYDQPCVTFTEDQINDFDNTLVHLGGSPLHWAAKAAFLESYLCMGFDPNGINLAHDSPLISKVKHSYHKCMMCLLSVNEVDVNHLNSANKTALFYSVDKGDITMTQTMLVFDSNPDIASKTGKTARHYAANLPDTDQNAMTLYVLAAVGAKRCKRDMKGCAPGCKYSQTFNGKRFGQWPIFIDKKFYKNLQLQQLIEKKRNELNDTTTDKSKMVNMISMDGGGVKGLISIQIMHELQKLLKHKFHEYFQWMSGTSTGSILAVALAQGKDMKFMRSIYFKFKDEVLKGHRPYDSTLLEKLLKMNYGEKTKMYDLLTEHHKFVVIPATMVDRKPPQLHLFRSFKSADELLDMQYNANSAAVNKTSGFQKVEQPKDQLVWKAVRASSAAPSYFTACDQFIDGGILANNPTMDMLVEFQRYNHVMQLKNRTSEMRQINLVLSLGTGNSQPEPFSLNEVDTIASFNLKQLARGGYYMYDMCFMLMDALCNSNFYLMDR